MCEYGETEGVEVVVPADLSHTGESYRKVAQIDKCLSPIVRALSDSGIHMRGSCCSHGQGLGEISLDDGRLLLVLEPAEAKKYEEGMARRRIPMKVTLPVGEMMATIRGYTIGVEYSFPVGIKRVIWRLRAAMWLIRLAIWVAGMKFRKKKEDAR